MQEALAAKRARADASTPGQSVGPPRPTVENAENEDQEQAHHSDHSSHQAASTDPGDQTQIASNAAGKKIDAAQSRAVAGPLQGSRNAHPGKIKSPTTTVSRLNSHLAAGQPGPRAAPPAGPADTMVDLTESGDEDEDNNSISPGKLLHPRVLSRVN